VPKEISLETSIASDNAPADVGVDRIGSPSTFACPECSGVLFDLTEGDHSRFRCHTGHAYSIESLVAEYDQAIEQSLWRSLRAMQEQVRLLGSLADHFRNRHGAGRAATLQKRVEQIGQRSEMLRNVLFELPDRAAKLANKVCRTITAQPLRIESLPRHRDLQPA